MDLTYKLEDIKDTLSDAIYDAEKMESRIEELEEDIDGLEYENRLIVDSNQTLYDMYKSDFIQEISQMYSLEELEKIFKKKQGYPLTKMK